MPLPDERSRGSVANLIGRFEIKTRKPDADGGESNGVTSNPVVIPRSSLNGGASTTANGPVKEVPIWMKKRETMLSKPSEVVPAPSSVTPTTPVVAEPKEVPSSEPVKDDPFVVPPTEVTSAAEPPIPVATPPTHTTKSEIKATKSVTSPAVSKPTRTTSTKQASTASTSSPAQSIVKSKPAAGSPATSASKATAQATPPLRNSKSTSSLKQRPTSAPRPAVPPVPTTKTIHPAEAKPLKPQHTGTSVASSSRRIVSNTSSPARAKTPAGTSSTTRPKGSSALYAPTASSLAKMRGSADQPPIPTPPKKTVPPSSFSASGSFSLSAPKVPRARAGSSGNIGNGLKPLQLPLKSSLSAVSSGRRMVSVPRVKDDATAKSPPRVRDRSPAKIGVTARVKPAAVLPVEQLGRMTSEEEMIVTGEIPAVTMAVEPPTPIVAETQHAVEDLSSDEQPDDKPETEEALVEPTPPSENEDKILDDAPAEEAPAPVVEEHPKTPEADVGAETEEHAHDQLERMVSMLERPSMPLYTEDDAEVPKGVTAIEPQVPEHAIPPATETGPHEHQAEIPDIPDD